MTTRRKFLQLLGIAPVIPSILKIPPAMAAIPEPTVEKIVNYVEQEIIRPGGDVVTVTKLYRIMNLHFSSEHVPEMIYMRPGGEGFEVTRSVELAVRIEAAGSEIYRFLRIEEEVCLHIDKSSFEEGYAHKMPWSSLVLTGVATEGALEISDSVTSSVKLELSGPPIYGSEM